MLARTGSTKVEVAYTLEPSALLRRTRLRTDGRPHEKTINELAEMVRAAAHPVALYRPSQVHMKDGRSVEIEGVTFSSRVLSKILAEGDIVFPYILTVGPELAALQVDDMLRRFWLDGIKEMVLHSAGQSLSDRLRAIAGSRRLTHMNPGEIDDWPIAEQRPLFGLFGGLEQEIGVTLTSGCVIRPIKSRSGIFFANDTGFETCRLCRQTKCTGRRAAYDAALVAKYTAD